MIQKEGDYRKILRDELETRFQRNRHYSLRAFARDLGVTPARLSDALSGTPRPGSRTNHKQMEAREG